MSQKMAEVWADPNVASDYRGAEQITGEFAKCLLVQAGLPNERASEPRKPLMVLDNACGTGVVSENLWGMLDEHAKEDLRLICGDKSPAMVEHVQKKIEQEGWHGAEARIVDAMDTELPDEHFTHVITNFGVMLMPDGEAALKECFRILQPSGVCALSTWDTVGWFPELRATFATLPGSPKYPDHEEFFGALGKGRWQEASFVAQKFTDLGFVDVKVEVERMTSQTMNAVEFCQDFTRMLPIIMEKFWSEEERQRLGPLVNEALLEHLKSKYGDGVVEMYWAAILATGRKPAD